MPLNAPTLPPEHPINRVTPNFSCPKCLVPDGLAKALQYGDGDKFPGKVYHFCAATPACKGVRCYTPTPFNGAQAGQLPAAQYPAYFHPAFAPPGFVPQYPPVGQPGQPPAFPHVAPHPAMAWAVPPGYPPGLPAQPWPPRPPGAHAAPAPLQTPCSGPLCRAKAVADKPSWGNQGCTLKFCKNCCQTQLLDDERALRSHDGCKAHKREAFRPNARGNLPARVPSPQIDPALQQAQGAADANAVPIPTHVQPAAAPPAPQLPPAAQPTVRRSLDLTWANITEAQTEQQLALATARQQVLQSKMHRVNVVMWYADGLPYRRLEVPVSSLACFSLDTDARVFLQTANITAAMFERFDLGIGEWTMVSREATMPVLALQHLLFRVCGVTTCLDFAKAVELAQGVLPLSSAPANNAKRLGEPVTSPPRTKRPCLELPGLATAPSGVPLPPHPPADPVASSSAAPMHDPSPPRVVQSNAVTPSFVILKPGMSFPGDFYFCDVVNALERSLELSTARKKLPRNGSATKRHAILAELLETRIPPSTLSHVERRVKDLKAEDPDKYSLFLRYAHTDDGLYKNLSRRRRQSCAPRSQRSKARARSASGTEDSPIDIDKLDSDDNAGGIDNDDADSGDDKDSEDANEAVSPLSARIRELEDEQEKTRPKPPVDIDLLPTTIDWDDVIERAESLLPSLWEIIRDPGSHEFCQELRRAFKAKLRKTMSLKQRALVSEFVHAGYYGPNGLGLAMIMTIEFKNAQLYSDEALTAIRPLRTEIFVERVLVRELILKLMAQDFSLDAETTVSLYDSTKWFGDRHHPLPPDDDVEPTSAADFWSVRRAREIREQLEREEEVQDQEQEEQAQL